MHEISYIYSRSFSNVKSNHRYGKILFSTNFVFPKKEFPFFFPQASAAIKRILPLFDRVLVERFAKETTTKGGIHIPEKAIGKVLNATVISVGKGLRQKVTKTLLSLNSFSTIVSGWFSCCCKRSSR